MPPPDGIFTPIQKIRNRRLNRGTVSEWLPGTGLTPTDTNVRSTLGVRDIHLWVRLGLLLILCGLGIRLVHLQIVQASTYRDKAERNRVRLERITAPRGLILDRTGVPLVENTPNFSVTMTVADLPPQGPEREKVLNETARVLAKPRSELDAFVAEADSTPRDARVLVEKLPEDQAIATTIAFQNLPGLAVIPRTSRTYHDPNAIAAVVGYMGKVTDRDLAEGVYSRIDMVGRTGLERQYESELRGQPGQRRVERNSTNTELRVIASQAATPGRDIVLGIDAKLQRALAEALAESVAKTRSPGGAAVAIDPRNGEIRALVSLPSYDPNAFFSGFAPGAFEALLNDPRHPFLNRAISGEYPSGSTIKPVVAAAGLDAGVITPSTTVPSTGGIRIGKWFFPDWKAGGHGATNVVKALAESVNTFFYMIGGGAEDFTGMGIRAMVDAVRKFGFGSPLGIDLPGEASGFLPSPEWKEEAKGERWYIGDTYHFSIGQGDLLVTPLQIANATAAIANGGTVYEPHLLHAFRRDGQEEIVQPRILSSAAARSSSLATVREGMREGVLSGSSRVLQALSVTAAGKTGTAQASGSDLTHAWFTSFAPYEQPELVITVIVERGGEGHAAALPVARSGYDAYFGSKTTVPSVDTPAGD
jgi:penicillin-binding protein 2